MGGYAGLIKLVLVLAVSGGLLVSARGCGKDAGLKEGEQERAALQAALDRANRDYSACVASIGLANNIADQAAAEAIRQQALAEQAVQRAAQAKADADKRIANLNRQLQDARRNPDAAAQLDLELHPSIPLL